ncbi:MAG: DUF4249 domain-containing protein [Prevotellaceae bacterium]|jgi:hypothetical protein|nr:DUF4249 domain-containing protein [Prevotellaceae bacterium]
MSKYLLIPIFIVSLFASCVEPFDIKTDNSPPVIVIYGYLTDELTFHTIKVSVSSPYFDKMLNKGVSGAIVKITSSENEVFNFREIDSIPGMYLTETKVAGIPGMTYSLSVKTDFDNDGVKESYTATSTMLSATDVDSINIKDIKLMGSKLYNLNLYAQDPPTEDYYLGRYKLNDSIILFSINRLSPMQDIAFNGQYLNGLTIQRFWDISEKERVEDEDEDEDDVERRRVYLRPGDTITLSLSRIERGYYDFINQCQKEMNGENPFFGGPASNIITNISNGGLGYFTTYAFSTVKTVVKED